MDKSNSTMAQQIARVASEFARQTTGHVPKSVAVVLSGDTLVITLHDALSEAEKVLGRSPAGAAQVQEFHRQLFATACDALRQEIKRITGVDVREAVAEVEPVSGTIVQVFSTGTMVQLFLLAHNLPTDTWSSDGQAHPSTPALLGDEGAGTVAALSAKANQKAPPA